MRVRVHKILSIIALLLVVTAIAGYFSFSHYKEVANMQRHREKSLDFFAATAKWIVFSVPLDNDVTALAVINRANDQRKLVFSPNSFLAFPHFSADGERILVVRGKETVAGSEVLSCTIENWNCRVLAQAYEPILWPVEVRKDVVLYVGSELTATGRRRQHDFFLVESPLQPIRLSTFELYQLNALNVVGDRIVFSAFGSLSRNKPIFPELDPLAQASSEIFMLRMDWKQRRLIVPSQPLDPLYKIDGFSTLPTVSGDGARVVFLNRRITAGRDRYNLAIATLDGTVQKYVEATTTRFSRPAFAESSVLANQLFEDRYETTLVDLSNNLTRRAAVLNDASSALAALERVEICVTQ